MIGAPGDAFEQEADRVADQVMHMPQPVAKSPARSGLSERPIAPAAQVQTKSLHTGDVGGLAAPPIVHDALRSPGQPLDTATRAFMEPRFGHDFSKVRVHADPVAAGSARAINALAYTAGPSIAFGAGRYAPATNEGRALLAHELTHVVQQARGGVAPHSVQRQYSHSTATTADPNALIPLANFIAYIEAVERAYPADTPQEIVTRVRTEYYKGFAFENLIPDAHYEDAFQGKSVPEAPLPVVYTLGRNLSDMKSASDPATVSAYQHLTAHADENPTPDKHGDNPSPYIVLPNGSRVDVGHMLLGLDSLLHPRVEQPYAAYDIKGIDPASWVADLALASYWTMYHALHGSPASDAAAKPATADFNTYYNASAPKEDLLGDADSFGIGKQWTGSPGQKLSQVLSAYYVGGSGNAPGANRRWRTFCAANDLNYTNVGGKVTWADTIEPIYVPRINRLCDLFDSGFFSRVGSITIGSSPGRDSWPWSRVALLRFLIWLKPLLEAEIAADH
ncbi:MAG TPA: DUF4157 domain-containing protein [Bradyrhizobium sp.]|nr:DUF4157 domain-containing protein [Bradyrhizobium sp.]